MGKKRPIPKTVLKPILAAVLSKLTSFRCIDKFFRQRRGLPMGDSCSPKLANFYLHMLEKDKIGKLIKNGTILGYKRFQDDTFVVFKKGCSEIVQKTFESLSGKEMRLGEITHNNQVPYFVEMLCFS